MASIDDVLVEWDAIQASGDQSESIKFIYAIAGLVLSQCQLLEETLTQFIVVDKLSSQGRWTPRQYDEFSAACERDTLGLLTRHVRAASLAPASVVELLEAATKQRNFLAHKLFRVMAADMETTPGRSRIIAKLRSTCEACDAAIAAIEQIQEPMRRKYGITPAVIQRCLDELIKAAATETNG